MLGSNTGRVRRLFGLTALGLLALAVAACAASRTMQSGTPGSESIADVRIERDDDATLVTLMGPDEPVFTAFSQRDPDRVVVDLAASRPDDLDALDVYDGLVDQVTLSSYETGGGERMTRIEVVLAMPGDYSVVPSEDGLLIRVTPLAGVMEDGDAIASADDESEDDPWAILPSFGSEDDEADEVPLAVAPSGPPATKLVSVEARAVGDGSLLQLRADGTIDSAESFTLENPDRLVIDLRGLASEVKKDRLAVGSPQAKQVRIGRHDDMVRIVIDAGQAENPFEGRRVIPVSDGMLVALGSGQALDWAVEEATGPAGSTMAMDEPDEEAAEEVPLADSSDEGGWLEPIVGEAEPEAEVAVAEMPAKASSHGGPVTVYGVEFDSQDGRDRIVILGERPVDYLMYEPSPDTVVVTIQNAVIDADAAVRIAPDPGGPVSLVTAFEQPEVRGSEVRVVVKRAPNLKPDVSRQGSLIVIDFPRDGSIAASPPILGTQPAIPGATASAMTPGARSIPGLPGPVAAVPALGGSLSAPSPAAAPASVAPASFEPAAAIDVLQEGGLVDGKQYSGRRISLDFKDIDMADVLRLIAEVSDLNVIAGEEVTGKVTIRLVDVPWDQALDVILLTKGLGFMRVGNVLRIAPGELLKQEEEARLQERRNLEQLEDLVVKLQPVNYADVKKVRGIVQRLLSSRGTVDTDERTNTLIIKDIPSVIDEATALIKAIDTQTPQVLIEAKIVEANLDFAREFGTTWGFGAQPLEDAFNPSSANRQDLGNDIFRLNTGSTLGNNASFINPLTAGPTALFNIAGFLLDEKLNLELQLQAAEINGDGKVISSPRVVTVDNNKATIEQGVSIPFQTFENGDAALEFVDAVLKLDVTPHITADKSIIMQIKVSRNAPDDSVFTLTGSPAIAKNQVDTETLVKDGQTLVLGGIYVVDKSHRQSRVPYLHRVPFIGSMFRSDEQSDARKELLIFVTPRIVVTPGAAS